MTGIIGPTDSDSTLVLRARGGDKDAFALLFARYQPLLRAVCRRYLGEQAIIEDVIQEAALQALLNLAALRQTTRFGPWLAGIGLNLCRRWRRDRQRGAWSWEALLGGVVRHEPIDWRTGPADLVVAAELQRGVQEAVLALPPGQRAAVVLFYFSGLSYAEIAAHLGTPVGAVRTRLHKARGRLRAQLASIWQEDHMTSETATSFTSMRIVDVRTRAADDFEHHVVLLQEVDGPRWLPIWVGPHEGTNVALLLERVPTPRPLASAFMASLLAAAGARLQQVRITRLAEDTFYAEAVVEGPGGVKAVDARPSDALMLALVTGAPVYAERSVLEQVGVVPNEEEQVTLAHQAEHKGAAVIVAKTEETRARRMQALMFAAQHPTEGRLPGETVS